MVIDLQEKINKREDQVSSTQRVGFAITRPSSSSDERGSAGRIAEGVFKNDDSRAVSHAAEPIKSLDDICKIQDYMLKEGLFRDNLLFTCGINFGLRISDLLKLQVGHLLDATGTRYNERVVLSEKKTGKRRVVYMNDAVMDAADLYFGDLVMREVPIDLNDYLFTSRSGRSGNGKPLDSKSVERILKSIINDKCGINVHASTHCLRKTFAYHVIVTAKDRPRAVEFLQKILGHSSQAITLRYAGITDEEIMSTYQELNLGSAGRKKWDMTKSSGYEETRRQAAANE